MSICDTNAHHVRWKSTGTNPRGESLMEMSKTLIYLTEFCVFHDLIPFVYGPGQSQKELCLLILHHFRWSHKTIKLVFYCIWCVQT